MSNSTPYLNRVVGQLLLSNKILNNKKIIYSTDLTEEELDDLVNKGFISKLNSSSDFEDASSIIVEGLQSLDVSLPISLYRMKSVVYGDNIYIFAGNEYPTKASSEALLQFDGFTLKSVADTVISREDGVAFLQSDSTVNLLSYTPADYFGSASQKINLLGGAITDNTLVNPLLKFYSSCEDDKYLYLIGGINPDNTNNVKVYRIEKANPVAFEVIGSLKEIRSLSACTVYKNSIYIIGGVQIQNGVYQGINTVEIFNLDLKESELQTLRIPNDLGFYAFFQTQLDSGRFLIAGGCFTEKQYSSAIYELSLEYLVWRKSVETLPSPLAYGACQQLGGYAYFIGGLCTTNESYRSILKYRFSNLPIPDPNLQATQLIIRHDSNNLSRRLITLEAYLYMSNGVIRTVSNNYDITWTIKSTKDLKISFPVKGNKNIIEVNGEGSLEAYASMSDTKSTSLTIPIYDIKSLEIYGDDSIILGSIRQYKALARYSNGALEDLKEDYYWQIINRSLVRFDNTSLITAVATGDFSLTAKFEKFQVTKDVNIYDRYSEIETIITDPRETYRVGQTIQLDVQALSTSEVKKSIMADDDVTMTILSKDQIQTTNNILGQYSLVKAGNGSIISRWEELNSYINIVIEEEILELRVQAPIRISKGDRFVVSVFVTFLTTGTSQILDISKVTFASDTPAVLSINALGQIVGEGLGESEISVIFEDKRASTIIIVE
ncbi:hypothetical protein [Ewingella americana]|uniref:BIG2 domain-containing protein n=1 Tax=Ewingella americana TaxID=41202 RepID=A0A502GEQ6_9GAMM|nr:hypothetical protein [Ewingella americana]TPG60102.1 hypothetical protein EAH77_16165 [Ewingella americana]